MAHYLEDEFYNQIFESSGIGVGFYSPGGQVIDFNNVALKSLGAESKSEVVGKNMRDLFPKENADVYLYRINQTIEKDEILEFEDKVELPSGKQWFLSTFSVVKDDQGSISGVQILSRNITDRKESQEALEKSEAWYRQLVETASDAIYLLDETGTIIDTNDLACEILQKDRSEVVGAKINTIDPNFSVKDFIEFWKDKPYDERIIIETAHINKEGNVIPVEVSAKKFKIDNETFFYSIARSLVEREKNARLIAESEDKFRGVFEYADIGIAIANGKGDFIDVNPTFLKFLGYSKEEYLTLNFVDISHTDDLKLEFQYMEQVQQGERDYYKLEKRIRKKNGEYFWASTSVATRRTVSGDADLFIGMVVDISDRKEAELILKEKNQEYEALNEELNEANSELVSAKEKAEEHSNRFKALVETTSDWIWEVKADGTFTYVSPRVQNLLGYTPDELIGLTAFDLMSKEEAERVEGIYAEYVNAKVPFSGMINVNIHKDGREVVIETNGIPILDKDGELLGYRGIDRDVTERKRAEQELIAAKEKAELANKLKTEFLNNMSHEIRTPMNGIIGFSEMLHEPNLNDEKKKYYTRIIQNSGRQLLRLIDDILEISALETKQEILSETEFYLNDLVMELFAIHSLKGKERKISLYVNKGLPDEQSLIKTDKSKLNKILTNLIENAIKFTSEGFVEFGYYLEKESLILYVKDSGIGIAEENHKIIFEQFTQENKEIAIHHGGLGLGLSISKENAKLLG
ncbi:MAG: PAS domain S-box protein, partial [Bacteroidales bacterium]|nr:PAS domain S-box protein [Bacteroidales bacterium]